MGKWDKYLVTESAPDPDAIRRAAEKGTGQKSKWDSYRAAVESSAQPLPTTKDIRPSTPPDTSLEPEEEDTLAPSSSLGAIGRGAVQGGTLRFGDEIGAGAMMPVEAIGRLSEKLGLTDRPRPDIEGHLDERSAMAAQDKSRGSMADAYRNLRNSLRSDVKTSASAHPVQYGLSEALAGSTLPLPGSALMKGAPLAAKMGLGTAQASGYGALAGAGGSEAEDVGDIAREAGRGALVSAPFGAAGGAMSHAGEKLAPYFSQKAGSRAFQAAGARPGITDRAAAMGISEADMPAEGRKFLEAGLIPTGLNPFKNPVKQTSERAKALKGLAGKRIGEAIGEAEQAGAEFDPLAAQEAMRGKVGVSNPLEAANAGKANKLIEQVGELSPQGEYAGPGSFQQANKMKSQAWKGADFRTDPALAPQLYKRAAGGLRDDIQRQVGAATSPETEAALAAANRQYGTASKAETLADSALSRGLQKTPFSPLRSMISAGLGGGLGAASGGSVGAGLGATVSPLLINAIAERGPNFATHFNELMSKASSSPEAAVALQKLAAQLGVKVEDLITEDPLKKRFGAQP